MSPNARPEKKATAEQPTFPSTASRSHQKPLRNANALPLAGEPHTASQQIPRRNAGAELNFALDFFV
jgi:hypothetical protein